MFKEGTVFCQFSKDGTDMDIHRDNVYDPYIRSCSGLVKVLNDCFTRYLANCQNICYINSKNLTPTGQFNQSLCKANSFILEGEIDKWTDQTLSQKFWPKSTPLSILNVLQSLIMKDQKNITKNEMNTRVRDNNYTRLVYDKPPVNRNTIQCNSMYQTVIMMLSWYSQMSLPKISSRQLENPPVKESQQQKREQMSYSRQKCHLGGIKHI